MPSSPHPRPPRRALLLGAAAGAVQAAACYPASFGGTFFGEESSFWTSAFFSGKPSTRWSGKWPAVGLRALSDGWPVVPFGDRDFDLSPRQGTYAGLSPLLPCGQLDFLEFDSPVEPLRAGKVMVVHAPSPRFNVAALQWPYRGVSTAGVARFSLDSDSARDVPLDVFVFPDRTHVFVAGRMAAEKMATAFAGGRAPSGLPMPGGALIAMDGPLDREVGSLLAELVGAGYPIDSREAYLFPTSPGFDAPLTMKLSSLWTDDRAREGAAEFRRRLPEVRQASLGVVRSEGKCRKPWDHFLASLTDIRAEGLDVVLRGTFPGPLDAYLFGAPFPDRC